MGKGWSIFGGGGSGFLEITIINFTSQLLFNLLSMCRLKMLNHWLFFTYDFSLFHFIKSFLIVF